MNPRFAAALESIDAGDCAQVDAPHPGVRPRRLLRGAAYHGHLEMVRYLLERGADPGLENIDGLTALDYAEQRGHKEVVKLLRRSR